MMDDRGQVSLEYMLVFAVFLILLMAFTMPMAEMAIRNTLDVSDSVDMKADLSKISHAVEQVYGEGQGSRHTVSIDSSSSAKVNFGSEYISCSLKLNDNSKKQIRVDVKSNLERSSLSLDEGYNSIVVEWPEDSESMIVYKN